VTEDLEICLKPTSFFDSNHPAVQEFARNAVGDAQTDIERGVRLYYAVRDRIRYDPYRIVLSVEGMRASTTLAKGYGYCVVKAVLLAASARSLGIPGRIGLADVRNHLTTERLRSIMKTDLFTYHGYSELYLGGRWVKATPTFNMALCDRFGVKPLDFDGVHDALLHPYDQRGNRHMEYVRDHGSFADVPLEQIKESFRDFYPFFFKPDGSPAVGGDFEREAAEDRAVRSAGKHLP